MSMLIGVGQEGYPWEPIGCLTSVRVSGFSSSSTLCFLTKLNFNRGGDPPSGGREGEKGKGGRAEGTCPRGALARSASPPLPPPPPGSQEPDRKSLSLFFFFFFFLLFRLNLSSAARLLSFHFLLSPTFHFATCCASPRS